MPEYLTKEEVRQWRSSIEKITLEEFAARLGKVVQNDKPSNEEPEVITTHTFSPNWQDEYKVRTEKIQTLSFKSSTDKEHKAKKTVIKPELLLSKTSIKTDKAEKQEKQISLDIKPEIKQDIKPEPVKAAKNTKETKDETLKAKAEKRPEKIQETTKKETKKSTSKTSTKSVKPAEKKAQTKENIDVLSQPVIYKLEDITFKKALIPREQMIFDYFVKNKNVIVYAKDLATLLELPRDYVYKYIKNLRQKIEQDVLLNADNGGYVLKI